MYSNCIDQDQRVTATLNHRNKNENENKNSWYLTKFKKKLKFSKLNERKLHARRQEVVLFVQDQLPLMRFSRIAKWLGLKITGFFVSDYWHTLCGRDY